MDDISRFKKIEQDFLNVRLMLSVVHYTTYDLPRYVPPLYSVLYIAHL